MFRSQIKDVVRKLTSDNCEYKCHFLQGDIWCRKVETIILERATNKFGKRSLIWNFKLVGPVYFILGNDFNEPNAGGALSLVFVENFWDWDLKWNLVECFKLIIVSEK